MIEVSDIMSKIQILNVVLNDNATLPQIVFVTYRLNGSDGVAAMASAICNGYRLLNSAFNYKNEGALGEAIRQAGAPRANLQTARPAPAP